MRKAKFFRYHVLGLLFWVAAVLICYFAVCKLTLPVNLLDSALGDAFGLFVIPGSAIALWTYVLAERALAGGYDEPTEWDELIEQMKDAKDRQ